MRVYEEIDGESNLEWVIGVSAEACALPGRPDDAASLLAFCRNILPFCENRERASWLMSYIASHCESFPSVAEARKIYSAHHPPADGEED